MVEVRLAKELGIGVKRSMSEIFVDGFGQHFTYFSKDKEKLIRAFEHMFNLNVFYLGVIDGEIVGMISCTNHREPSVQVDKAEMVKYLGFIKGNIAYMALARYFEKSPYKTGESIASVEFVVSKSNYKRKGVAKSIMECIFKIPRYKSYVLEVADTNESAIRLYENLGFKEFARVKEKYSKRTGINCFVYMEYSK